MAALTWRNVDLPNFDLRSLAIAGNGVSDAFSRMGQLLIDREASLRNEATKAATAKLLLAGSPEELEALRKQGTAGLDPRVDALTYGTTLNSQIGALQQRALTQESLLDKQAAASLGDEGAALVQAASRGDKAAMDQIQAKAAADPLWGRVAYGYMNDAATQFGNAQTRGETSRHNLAGEATDRAQVANQSRQVAIAEQARAEQHLQFVRGEQERRDEHAGNEFGRRFFDNLDGKFAGSAAELLARTPQFQAANPETRRGMLAGATGRGGEVLKDTPFNTSTDSAIQANVDATRANSSGQVVNTLINEHLAQNNPGLAILRRSEDPKYKDVTIDQVIKRYEETGIYNPAPWIERQQARGVPLSRLMAAPDVIDMNDRGATLDGLDLRSGTIRADKAMDSLIALQEPGSLAAAQQGLDAQLAPGNALQARLNTLNTLANAERQKNNGQVSADTLMQIRAVRAQMEALAAAAQGK